jgi:hypothetical protein
MKNVGVIIGRTNRRTADQGYTYNQAGLTYNHADVQYGGIYDGDIYPMTLKSQALKPGGMTTGDIDRSLSLYIKSLSGLLAYWPLNELSGNALNQAPASFGTLPGTVTGATQGVEGQVGRAYDFDGNDKVAFGNNLLSNTVVSVFFIFRPQANSTSNQETIFGYGNTRWFFIYGNTTTNFRFAVRAPTEKATLNTSFTPTINSWYAVLGTYDPDSGSNNLTLRVYGEGQGLIETEEATITGAIATTVQPIEIAHDPNRNFFVDISAQHLAVFDRVITAEEGLNMATLAGLV